MDLKSPSPALQRRPSDGSFQPPEGSRAAWRYLGRSFWPRHGYGRCQARAGMPVPLEYLPSVPISGHTCPASIFHPPFTSDLSPYLSAQHPRFLIPESRPLGPSSPPSQLLPRFLSHTPADRHTCTFASRTTHGVCQERILKQDHTHSHPSAIVHIHFETTAHRAIQDPHAPHTTDESNPLEP